LGGKGVLISDMSRLATYETEIVLPVRPKPDPRTGTLNIPKDSLSLEIMRLALEKTARDHGGTVFFGPEAFYSDCEGRRYPALFSLHPADFPRGIGINIAPDGRLTFAYDAAPPEELAGKFNAQPEVAQRICKEIAHNYAVIAIMRAQAKLGFRVGLSQTSSQGRKVVLVTGVKP